MHNDYDLRVIENFFFSDRIHTTVTNFIILEPATWIISIGKSVQQEELQTKRKKKEVRWNSQE
jgi:hypothetical protein